MLTAIRESDKLIVIGAIIEKDKSNTYKCSYCQKSVIHCKSESGIKIGYFKHKAGESHCPNQVSESEEHLRTKLDIYEYISNDWGDKLQSIEVEKWICNNTIRSDIYLETKKNKIAIEVQATALTVDEIKRRTSNYFKNGIAVLWVMPYYHKRFMEFKYQAEGFDDETCDYGWSYVESVKLKSMEIFLFWMYYKSLYFFFFVHINSNGFIKVTLGDYVGEAVEFIKDGEEHYYAGRVAKTLKTIKSIRNNLSFEDFRVEFGKEFKVPKYNYSVPNRKIFTLKRDKN